MNDTLKIILICLLSTLFAFAAPKVFFTESDAVQQQYDALYQKIASRDGQPTEDEQKALQQMFLKLNTAKNIQAEALEKVARYGLFLGIVIPVMFLIGRRFDLKRDAVLIICGVTFAAYFVAGAALIGALVATIFFIASQSRAKPGPVDGVSPE